MRRALALARRSQGLVEPNPMVGCVLVRDGRILGTGYHRRYGGPHAEVEALRDCQKHGQDPAGCDVYVTLEPCCHHGKTPPCTDALIAARPRRVIAAMIDPFPQVAGGGVTALRAAGIEVQVGMEEEQACRLNEPFFKRLATGLPWVIAKWAQTLDGRIATATGQSKWISNDASRTYVHKLRARMDAVLVGIGTALADDPRLTARGVRRQRVARRVVVDPSLRLPETAKLLVNLDPATADGAALTLAVGQSLLSKPPDKLLRLRERGVEFVGLPPLAAEPARLSLRPLLAHLAGTHQATNVLVEGGATLMGCLLQEGLVDEDFGLYRTQAPGRCAGGSGGARVDGGNDGPSPNASSSRCSKAR